MTASEFWNIIARSGDGVTGVRQTENKLRRLLLKLDPDEIVSFNEWFGHFVREAFLHQLWGSNLGETPPDAPFSADAAFLQKQYPKLSKLFAE